MEGYKPISFMEDVEIQSRFRKEGKFKNSLGSYNFSPKFDETRTIFQFVM